MPTPKFDSLPKDTQDIIQRATANDQYLYGALVARWKRILRQQDASFREEVAAFKRIQAELVSTCKVYPIQPVCMWYGLSDGEYLKLFPESRYCTPVSFPQA